MDGLDAAEAQRDEACAAAAAAASELEVVRARLAEAEAAQARTMADLQVGCDFEDCVHMCCVGCSRWAQDLRFAGVRGGCERIRA
jgi:hypothetical protein